MFVSCEKLIGGKGTKWFSDHTDFIYARIDGGASAPGYFTYKAADIIVEGDANGDGKVDQKDIELVSEFIMTGVEPEGFVWRNADANGDSKINAADIVEIVNIMKTAAQQWFLHYSALLPVRVAVNGNPYKFLMLSLLIVLNLYFSQRGILLFPRIPW